MNKEQAGAEGVASNSVSEDRLRNTRAWAAARLGILSGAEVIIGAIDELLRLRRCEFTLTQGPPNCDGTHKVRVWHGDGGPNSHEEIEDCPGCSDCIHVSTESSSIVTELREALNSGKGNYGHRLLRGRAAEEIARLRNVLQRINRLDPRFDANEVQHLCRIGLSDDVGDAPP